jgi:hypothetical protein
MAPQQKVLMGGFLDTTDNDLSSETSTIHSSKVPRNITAANDCMLRGFLRIRDHHIDKGSVKRLKQFKWKLVASLEPTTTLKALIAALTTGMAAPTASTSTRVQASPSETHGVPSPAPTSTPELVALGAEEEVPTSCLQRLRCNITAIASPRLCT